VTFNQGPQSKEWKPTKWGEMHGEKGKGSRWIPGNWSLDAAAQLPFELSTGVIAIMECHFLADVPPSRRHNDQLAALIAKMPIVTVSQPVKEGWTRHTYGNLGQHTTYGCTRSP
jgi:hypothetical protein